MTGSDFAPDLSPPSRWIARFAANVPTGGRVLDVAAGRGRHAKLFLDRSHPVTAVDRDVSALPARTDLEILEADLEDGSEWPLAGRSFAAVVVANYLYRPLFPALIEAVTPDGILIYETFGAGNADYGKPSNPDFLLKPGELLDAVEGRLRILAYECGYTDDPKPAVVQRIAAVRGDDPAPIPPRG